MAFLEQMLVSLQSLKLPVCWGTGVSSTVVLHIFSWHQNSLSSQVFLRTLGELLTAFQPQLQCWECSEHFYHSCSMESSPWLHDPSHTLTMDSAFLPIIMSSLNVGSSGFSEHASKFLGVILF